jgi:hypothetical protein
MTSHCLNPERISLEANPSTVTERGILFMGVVELKQMEEGSRDGIAGTENNLYPSPELFVSTRDRQGRSEASGQERRLCCGQRPQP